MEPLVISKADYEAGNYPKGVPIMVDMSVSMEGNSGMNVGKKEPIKITIKLKTQ